jgi:hypothetical protein
MFPEESLQRGPVFLNECLVGWANRILTSGLLDWSSIALDFASFSVIRFITHDDDVAFEPGNVFDEAVSGIAIIRNSFIPTTSERPGISLR